MSRIPPTEEQDGKRTVYRHPAFGFVRISRPHGGDPNLFMSNVKHEHKVALTIGTAYMDREHHHDRHFAEDDLITVEMSSVQFADMLAGLSTRGGSPCTIRRRENRVLVPGIDIESTTRRSAAEMQEAFQQTGAKLQDLSRKVREQLVAAKVSKSRQAAILDPIETLATQIRSNLPFMSDMFQETVEGLVQEAKAVVEAYAEERGIGKDEAPLIEDKRDA